MTGLVRKATLFTACGVLVAAAAMAGVPSPANSSVPACFSLMGSAAGSPDAYGTFTITVRDLANNPINGSSVVLDFSGPHADMVPCDDQLNGAVLVNCVAKTVRQFTDALGQATFTVLGGSNGGGNAVSIGSASKVYADGVLLASPGVSVFDLDDAGGVGANDLSAWLGDFGSGFAYSRADYDCSGDIGANDLSLWLGVFGAGTSSESCTGSCP